MNKPVLSNNRNFQAAFPIPVSVTTQVLSSLPLEGSRTSENIVFSSTEAERVGKKYKEKKKLVKFAFLTFFLPVYNAFFLHQEIFKTAFQGFIDMHFCKMLIHEATSFYYL